ncbi:MULTISPECIES: phage major capsid protein [unclassified Cupriavidus]|uniref:phage major capsid protein n=1 Tax=unclassified Cupriavidus TaxID=2640874 RepID=UPI001C0039B1|nr:MULTISPECIES: phage major capsid protein [unclassified Cupriavidus]MCA3187906.1 phage major capsid protein [Cupriavidus sp.]MCA3189453.1 phage major capsid protein [Cupriavidus sp.]MCA3195533.1 phage major capsid protein [Cupriavidus sp.]MCA3201088.1 phage major capsid protein [Cupriavidus sp.]MCA3207898.1 phage major capsid protein [Cupriavidus sp.]
MIVGNTYVKFLKCMAKAGGDPLAAAEIHRKDYGDGPALGLIQKAIITTGNLGGDAAYQAAVNDFVLGVQTYDVMARINALSPLHSIPVRTRVLVESEEPVAQWIGEGEIKVASGASFEELTIQPEKAAGLIVVTKEVVQLATDAAEKSLTRSLQRAVAKITSAAAFASPSVAGAPASLLDGATEIAATGDVQADMSALVAAFAGDIERAVLVMSSNTAMTLALQVAMVGGAGTLGVRGGTFCGLPTVASADVPDSIVALVDASGVTYGDDGVRLDTATQATVTIDDVQHSLWQENLIGFLAERFVSWLPAPGAVAYLSGVSWTSGLGGTQ